MKITLLHPPHQSIGSRVPKENLPPLGLLSIGGPLLDAGHNVRLVNADIYPMSVETAVDEAISDCPDCVMIGHSGSTSAHPVSMEISRRIKELSPETIIIYGGVYPTYHWKDVLDNFECIDYIVRGEGEETICTLMSFLSGDIPVQAISGVAHRVNGTAKSTRPAQIIKSLDDYRIAWELIDHNDYSYWGGRKAVILQFSRGCPHLCTYCGQRGFWTKWRHRDPVKFASEIARLVREEGVELINLADENPTSSKRQWRAFLEAMIAEDVEVEIIGSTRADDIVRDKDFLHLYKKAGVLRFLLGLEGTDEETLVNVKKGGTRAKDREAIQLLRHHGIIGLCTFAVGFEEETDADYWRLLLQLRAYDPDQIMSVFATPHQWTPFFNVSKDRRVILDDLSKWDYKHQVMETPKVPAWRVFLWVKFIELALQARPKAIWRCYFHKDPQIRHAMRWYTKMGRRVILRETFQFLFKEKRRHGGSVSSYFNGSEQLEENSMVRVTLD